MSGSNMQAEPQSPVHKVWKPELYKYQMAAPTPKAILRPPDSARPLDPPAPSFYGREFHGTIDHRQTDQLFAGTADGHYLVRRSPGASDFYTLSLKIDRRTRHYRIAHDGQLGHYLVTQQPQQQVRKHFETVHEMAADGLLDFYMCTHAADILRQIGAARQSYHQSPYMTLNRRKLRALSGDLRRSLKLESSENEEELAKELAAEPDTTERKDAKSAVCDLVDVPSPTTSPTSPMTTSTEDVLPPIYQKPHAFRLHTFKGLNWCELCANFLWGFTAQGKKCADCGFVAHQKCSEVVPAKCVPDLKRIRGVFGIDLTRLVAAHQAGPVPFVVRRCVDEVEARGMLLEGIYRVSGFSDEIDALKLALDRNGENADMSEQAYENVHVVAGTLKMFLRLLPVPLVTYGAYATFIQCAALKSVGEQVLAIREAMKQLPPAHFDCLRFVIEHLNRVASQQALNKMTEHNLATVFAPTLIAIPNHLTDLSQEICMLSTLIANCQAVYC